MARLVTFIAWLSVLSFTVHAFFVIPGSNLISARMDPIVSPGLVAGHVHNIVGGNHFSAHYDYNDSIESSCSSTGVKIDFSNYWAPALYYLDTTSGETVFQRLDSTWNIYYLLRKADGEEVKAWPVGLRMLAGDAKRSTYDPDKEEHQAVSFHCLNYDGPDGGEYPEFPPRHCPSGIRAQVFFPSCWNGKDLDSTDHKSHMSYPVGAYNAGRCPSTHPHRLISLFYEQIFYDTGKYSFRTDQPMFALSTGDTTGYSYHADFTMGWAGDILQRAVDTCDDPNGVLENCAVLLPYIDRGAANACKPVKPIPQEDVGATGVLKALPGDNALWSKDKPKVSTGTAVGPPTLFPNGQASIGSPEAPSSTATAPSTLTTTTRARCALHLRHLKKRGSSKNHRNVHHRQRSSRLS